MHTVIQMNSIEELDETILQSLKTLFKDKRVTVTISDSWDETEYLLSNETNKNHLLASLEQVKNGQFISFHSFEDLEKSFHDNQTK
ncbi:MAG: hypothetical protein H7A23_13120 [Leptospiraceae bacterium]|nr:hypothetical protein [Leptospiraceae bacterium]